MVAKTNIENKKRTRSYLQFGGTASTLTGRATFNPTDGTNEPCEAKGGCPGIGGGGTEKSNGIDAGNMLGTVGLVAFVC